MARQLLPSLVLVAVMSPRAASAQPVDDVTRARELFREGSALAERSDWEGARDRFSRSLKLKRAPLTLYNLGIAQEETGHLVDALQSFRAFLAQPSEPATQRYVEPVKADVAKLETRAAHIAIEVRPAGLAKTVVLVDGRDASPSSDPRIVDPGAHEIVVTAPGFGETRETTSLADGARMSMVIKLAPAGRTGGTGVALPIVLTVGGVAAVAGGAVVLGIGARQALSAQPDSGATRTMIAGAAVSGVGALALGAGVALLLVRSAQRPDRARIVPWISGSAAGVSGRF